jgi:ankyrin repeat protein
VHRCILQLPAGINPEMVERLLDAGAHVDLADNEGSTALTQSVCNGQLEIVEILVKAKADVLEDY